MHDAREDTKTSAAPKRERWRIPTFILGFLVILTGCWIAGHVHAYNGGTLNWIAGGICVVGTCLMLAPIAKHFR